MPLDITKEYLRFRQASPSQFKRLRTQPFGKGIKGIIGYKNGKSHVQSIIFKRSKYSITKARAWLKKHGYKYQQKRNGVSSKIKGLKVFKSYRIKRKKK